MPSKNEAYYRQPFFQSKRGYSPCNWVYNPKKIMKGRKKIR